jgi:NADPH:quinone reductase-like Zn-dependent oxidoreductase
MKALRIERFGEPSDVLAVVELDPTPTGPDEVRVRVEAAGVNPSDVANVRGRFPITTLPRIVGRDFAGSVVEGPDDWIGLPVWGAGGDIGFRRDGSHAQFINVPKAAISLRPRNLSAEEAAAVGIPFLTAESALDLARIEGGNWVIVSGAAGAVGNAAVELAHAKGARVIALVRDEHQSQRLDRNKVDAIAQSDLNNLEEVIHDATNGKGADVALNGIGASVFPAFLSSLAAGGRMVIYGAALGGREAAIDLLAFYRKHQQLFGLNTVDIDEIQAAKILSRLAPLFEKGELSKPLIAERYPLADAAQAYERVGTAKGKVVLQMAD